MLRLGKGFVIVVLLWLGVALLPTPVHAQAENGFVSPADGEIVSGVVNVTGYGNRPQLRRVEVHLLLFGDEKRAIFLGLRNSPLAGRIAIFDSRHYPDGEHKLRMRLIHQARNYDEYFVTFVIRNAGVELEDTNGITGIRPIEGITVRGPVRIQGIANDPAFQKWQLHLLPFENADRAQLIAENSRPLLLNGILVSVLDTARFPDGEHTLRLRVLRKDNSYRDYPVNIIIDNATPRTAANNAILAPADGAVVSCTIRVLGIADHPQFRKWQLDILPFGATDQASFLNWAELPFPRRGQLMELDTTRFPDGEHVLRLRVVRSDQNYDEYFRSFVIDNHEAPCTTTTEGD